MTVTKQGPGKGAFELTLVGPPAAIERFGSHSFVVEGYWQDDHDVHTLEYNATEELLSLCGERSYDELPEACCPLEFSEPRRVANEFRNADDGQQYFVTVYRVGQGYGGPEEGGWWFTCGERVRQYAVASHDEATELRERLQRSEFPLTGKRSSVLGGEDYDISIDIRPGPASFPESRPHYE